MLKNGIDMCDRMGCATPVREPQNIADFPKCSRHGGETKPVWTLYHRLEEGWLTDNDTLIEWVRDVDNARWFGSREAASDVAVDLGLDSAIIVRLK